MVNFSNKMNKKVLVYITLICFLSLVSSTTFGKDEEQKLTDYLNKLIPSNGPGGVVGVLKNGEVIYKYTRGYEDLVTKKPISENTLFDLASVSKHITGSVILHLIQNNRVQPSVLVETILTELKDKFSGRKMKLQDITSMISGFKDYEDQLDLSKSNAQDILNMLVKSTDTFDFPTGTKYSYSNTAYSLLPLIVKRITNDDFSTYLKREFFDKLGMNTANVLEKGLTFDWVKGYKKNSNDEWVFTRDATPFITGDGNIYFTFNDFAKWDKSLWNYTILNKESMDKTLVDSVLDDGTKSNYSYGWEIMKVSGNVIGTTHDGSWDGTSTVYARYLDGYSYFAMFNIDGYDTDAVSNEIKRIMNTADKDLAEALSSNILTYSMAILILLSFLLF